MFNKITSQQILQTIIVKIKRKIMKRVLIISIISLFALNVFSQTDTINVNKERRNTNINIPQLGITKISVVLDILNQNSSLLESSYIQINDENGNSIFGQNGYEALKDISTTYNKNNSLSDKGVKVLMALVEKVQKYGILHVLAETACAHLLGNGVLAEHLPFPAHRNIPSMTRMRRVTTKNAPPTTRRKGRSMETPLT